MDKPLSVRQKNILKFIQQHLDAHGYPPTVREIGSAVNLSSSSTVHAHLKTLEDRGHIQREAVLTRAIKLKGSEESRHSKGFHGHSLAILGTVAAGKPRLAAEDIEGYFSVPDSFMIGEGFILVVTGDSMIEDGIHDGDYVIVRRQTTAENGETVVALIEGEATVKRFYRESDRIRLQPANSSMEPVYAKNVTLAGKVVGLIRRFS
jgi:repressor LexA